MAFEKIFGNSLVAYQHAYRSRFIRELAAGEAPPLGAHLVTPWRGFAHHGIHVGDGRVVHYNARVYRFDTRPVEETGMDVFAEGRPVFVVTHAEGTDDAAEIVARARSRIGEDRYHLLNNNCEHFAEWCLHGIARSFQVESALEFPQRAGDWWTRRIVGLLGRAVRRGLRAVGRDASKAGRQ